MTIAAMKQALEALEYVEPVHQQDFIYDAMTALRADIEQAEKCEPVAWLDRKGSFVSVEAHKKYGTGETKLYAHPAPADVDINPETVLRLIETIKYMVGIAEKGRGYKCPDDVLPERFLLEYVIELEAPVPAGMVLVPVEMTDEVNVALGDKYGYPPYGWKATYKRILSVLAAAPKEKS